MQAEREAYTGAAEIAILAAQDCCSTELTMCKEYEVFPSACRASWWPASSMLRMAWIQRRCASAAFTSALSFTQLCVPLLPHFILCAV